MDIEDSHKQEKNSTKTLTRPTFWGCVGVFLYIIWSATACGPGKGDTVKSEVDTLVFTTMTRGVETLVSDSGVTKYKLVAELWYTYDQPEKKWRFPEGIYLEQFDTLFNAQATVKADSAYYYEAKKLWHLMGNVEVMNREGQKFFSNSLFWNQEREEVYSHDSVRIIRSEGQELRGKYGFKSNQDMTSYMIFTSSGHMDVDKDATSPTLPKDSIKADSIAISETLDPSLR
ncbi:LPS export ABC transporter periplasmic protein LptC [Porphyromonas sp.]|uniref:LPS export ABC transporter periplasmic protein LptC n=1 Tax=Porphyromonas sp. TaxID=1924944 RepID=UPI0026DB5DE6|nr:LPS export ABC transporter periplasmic protein LptC [Porphyromonas sp.]MDO4770615.1 LPS export ABC transporter periplasmic protein LptC [Porphyromonas sp.]